MMKKKCSYNNWKKYGTYFDNVFFFCFWKYLCGNWNLYKKKWNTKQNAFFNKRKKKWDREIRIKKNTQKQIYNLHRSSLLSVNAKPEIKKIYSQMIKKKIIYRMQQQQNPYFYSTDGETYIHSCEKIYFFLSNQFQHAQSVHFFLGPNLVTYCTCMFW